MKKFSALAVICLMLISLLIPAAGAEDGIILFQDNFDSGVLNELDWADMGTLFTIEKGGPTKSGHLEGYADAIVQQTSYGEEAPAPRIYGPDVAFKVDCFIFEDGGRNDDSHSVALWWADHLTDEIGNDRITYMVTLNYEERKVAISASGEGAGKEFFDNDVEVASWTLPETEPLVMDSSNPTVFNLGMRVNGNQIDGFYNDKKVVSYTAPRMGAVKCPLLLWNMGCHCGFDNFVVSTANYDLFNEGATPEPGPTPTPNPTPGPNPNPGPMDLNGPKATQIVTQIADVTDASGNVVTDESGNKLTQVVSDVVTVPTADTNTGAHGVGGAATGDTAVAVIAVMIIALGSAIAVKKISEK